MIQQKDKHEDIDSTKTNKLAATKQRLVCWMVCYFMPFSTLIRAYQCGQKTPIHTFPGTQSQRKCNQYRLSVDHVATFKGKEPLCEEHSF